MFAHWARQGFVVVCLNHCEGSSSRAVNGKGKEIYYHHPPGLKGREGVYPPDFREKQVRERGEEFFHITQAIINSFPSSSSSSSSSSPCIPHSLHKIINPNKIIAAGFSYGAATAVQALSSHPSTYSSALLLDGWFALDLASIDSCPVKEIRPFPPSSSSSSSSLSMIPCCFIGTTMFDNIPHLRKETNILAEKGGEGTEVHILKDTIHWSFVDLVIWLGRGAGGLYKRMGKGVGVETRAEESYVELFDVSTRFLLKVKGEGKEKEE